MNHLHNTPFLNTTKTKLILIKNQDINITLSLRSTHKSHHFKEKQLEVDDKLRIYEEM